MFAFFHSGSSNGIHYFIFYIRRLELMNMINPKSTGKHIHKKNSEQRYIPRKKVALDQAEKN